MSMQLSWQMSQNSDPVKELPKSVMIRLGTPNLCVISLMNSTALAADVYETGFTTIHLENLSMAMDIYECSRLVPP